MTAVPELLKYFGLALTTALGVLGLLVNFRNERTRHVTGGGRLLIVGIVASGLIVILLQAGDDLRKDKERDELFEQLAQGQYALRDVKLSCWARISLDDPVLVPVRQRFIAAATNARTALNQGAKHVPGIGGWGHIDNRPVSQISICSDSFLFPNSSTESRASSMLRSMEVVLRVYREPIRTEQYPVHGYGRPGTDFRKALEPDLEMTFRNAYDAGDKLCLNYDFDTHSFEFYGWRLKTDPEFWKSSGKIVSLVNLRGAQLFVEVTPLPTIVDDSDTQSRVMPTMRTVLLQVGELNGFWIEESRMVRHFHVDGTQFYEFRFPPTMNEILDLRRPPRH